MKLRLRVAGAARPIAGESVCGDQWAVMPDEHGITVVLADGLGHGPAAAAAASRAVSSVRERLHLGLTPMLEGVHRELRTTRGAAVTIVRLDHGRAQGAHVAVGNVEMTGVTRVPVRAVASPGVVGARMRRFQETTFPIHSGDLFVLYTDGISSRLSLDPYRALEPHALVTTLLERHSKAHDDAGCVAIRC
jgi:phosphoserine phosphatase RsbX